VQIRALVLPNAIRHAADGSAAFPRLLRWSVKLSAEEAAMPKQPEAVVNEEILLADPEIANAFASARGRLPTLGQRA
jgi:hypothetical protein